MRGDSQNLIESPPFPRPVRRPELRALTGARFVAALAVVVGHLSPPDSVVGYFYGIGGAAVAFFFVLSGFVLTYTYAGRLETLNGSTYCKFLQARFARVYPVHLVMLLAVTAVVVPWLLTDPAGLPSRYQTVKLVGGWFANLCLIQCYFLDGVIQDGWNAPAWSISCEAAFYALFPLLLLGISRLRSGRAILVAAAGTWLMTIIAIVAIDVVFKHVFHLRDGSVMLVTYRTPFVRTGDFLVGCLAGMAFLQSNLRCISHRPSREAAVWAGTAYIVVLSMLTEYLWGPFRVAVLFVPAAAIVVLALSSGPTMIGRWLSTPTLILLGEASYSLYLLHWLPHLLLKHYVGTPSLGLALGAAAGCVPVSVLMFRFIEDPCRRWLRPGKPPCPCPR